MNKEKIQTLVLMALLTALAACSPAAKTPVATPAPATMYTAPEEPENIDIPPAPEEVTDIPQAPTVSVIDFNNSSVILFDFDQSNVREDQTQYADIQAEYLLDTPGSSIVIEGHTDARGTRDYNLALGKRRADSVKSYLMVKGVASRNMKTISYGEERPEVKGNTKEAYDQNRRTKSILAPVVGSTPASATTAAPVYLATPQSSTTTPTNSNAGSSTMQPSSNVPASPTPYYAVPGQEPGEVDNLPPPPSDPMAGVDDSPLPAPDTSTYSYY